MSSHIAGFFQQIDVLFAELRVGMFGVVFVNQLREPQSTSHACRAAADNDDIGLHCRAFNIRERGAKHDHLGLSQGQCNSCYLTKSHSALVMLCQTAADDTADDNLMYAARKAQVRDPSMNLRAG